MSSQAWINLAYLVASMLFIVAFKLMTGPRTAVKGNVIGAAGMAIALLAACCEAPVAERLAKAGLPVYATARRIDSIGDLEAAGEPLVRPGLRVVEPTEGTGEKLRRLDGVFKRGIE
jgi:hypothetical protein